MRAVVQKVSSSKVTVDGAVIGQINQGLLVLLGVTHDDTSKDVDYMVDKVTNLRIFEDENGKMKADSGWTKIFIYPGYEFKVVDNLITNFHLPESTLIMLVSALAGKENVLNAYECAVENKYRFFSFGDAMFIK